MIYAKYKIVRTVQFKMLFVQCLLLLLVILMLYVGFASDNKMSVAECIVFACTLFLAVQYLVNKYILNNIIQVDAPAKDLQTDINEGRCNAQFQNSQGNPLLFSQLAAILDNTPLLAFVQDLNGHFLFGNIRACNFHKSFFDTTFDGERIYFEQSSIDDVVLTKNPEVIKHCKSIYFDIPLLSKSGDRCRYRIHKTPLKNASGDICAIVILARNIDIEKRISDERETYIATLSHDLKTPTIAQIRALELLLDGQLGDLNQDQIDMLKLILDSCNHMYNMVYTLLSTYKFENGDISLNYSSFDINLMINEAINEISDLADEYSIKIAYNAPVGNTKVCADKIELKKAIINILSNSINYAYPSTVVHVDMKFTDGNAEFKVINSSPYIEPDVMAKLFKKYVTHSEKYNKVGIGLGLYLTKKIINAHEGKIIAESSETQHNTWGFSIPVSHHRPLNKIQESLKVQVMQ